MNFKDLYGNNNLKNIMKNMIGSNLLPHAILLSGMDGIGKFGFARAMAVNITSLHSKENIDEIDKNENAFAILNIYYVVPTSVKGSGNNGLFTQNDYFKSISYLKNNGNNPSYKIPLGYIQYIISQLKYKSFRGANRIIIIRDAEAMTTEAQNALLKILEEPPDKVFFILTTSNEDKLLPTILSRCSRHLMRGLTREEMKNFLSKTDMDENKSRLLLLLANGSPGNLMMYSQFDIDKIVNNLEISLKKRRFTELLYNIERNISENREKKQLILKIYKKILLLILYNVYTGNSSVFNYTLGLRKNRIETVLDKIVEMEKKSIYNLSWEIEWGILFYNLIGG